MNDRQKQQRAEFLDRMLTEVHKISVIDVVGSVVELVRRGRNYLGLCPFHPDNHLGSFVVTPDKNIWWCFADGFGGDAINFKMRYDNISYLDAAFRLAREYQVITEDEYNRYSGKKWDSKTVEKIRDRLEEPKKVQLKKASPRVCAVVYQAVSEVCTLSEAHRAHLLRERHLQESELKDYFTFPTRRMDLPGKVYKNLWDKAAMSMYGRTQKQLTPEEKRHVSERMAGITEAIPSVPGFYRDTTTGKIDFCSYKGIGFLVRDENGMPEGIQIRKDVVKEGEQRYVWFSSAFAQAYGLEAGGASSGSPGGFIPAKTGNHPALCITEGRFKAEKIADKGNDAVYVSGVSTWKSVIPIVKRIQTAKGIQNVFLMFDADMLGNVAVHRQLHAMCTELSEMGLNCRLILWNIEAGKGFDDLVNNKGTNYSAFLKSIRYSEFDALYQNTVKNVLTKFQASDIRDIKPEQADVFRDTLQSSVEEQLKLA